MRHFKKGLATFALTTAVLVPAGLAGASAQSASTPVKAPLSSSGCGGVVNVCLFDIYVNDVLSHNNVTAQVAAPICGNTVGVLSLMAVGSVATCPVAQTVSIVRVK